VIYMVDHVYTDPATEPAWHEWYSGYLRKLISVPGLETAQRFNALDCMPPRYLAMYSIESDSVYRSDAYKNIGGGGSQSARFHSAYGLWTRNLFDGAARAPILENGQRIVVFDRETRDGNEDVGTANALLARATWLEAVGLHMTTRYRGFVVLDAGETVTTPVPRSYVYEPFTSPLIAR
jgi:hypothetical protein